MKKDMGGMRKWMPHTFRTFMVATAALIGIFPLAGFWSKDEILAGASQLGGEGNYTAFLIVGITGALMTAAYMTRCVYLTFFGEHRGHAAEGHGHPHESGPRIVVPLYILSGLAVIAGLANIPAWFPGRETWELRFEHFYEPKGAYFPSVLPTFDVPEFDPLIALGSTVVGVLGITLAYLWYWKGAGPHGITERSRPARAGYTLLTNKYYFDRLYTDGIAGGIKGPVARAADWTNQNILDGVVNGAGRIATVVGRFVYTRIDQGIVDTVVDGSGAAAEGGGQIFRRLTSGRVQNYGALLFGATALFAGALIIFI